MSHLTLQSLRAAMNSLLESQGFDRVLNKACPGTRWVPFQTHREYLKVVDTQDTFLKLGEHQWFCRIEMTLLSASPGKVVCEMKVDEEHTNRGGTLHGGMTATLVDVVSTAALLYTERGAPGVSVDMNITYMSAAKIGEDIVITAEILKQGRKLAFASVDLTNKATGKLIAQGRHTKFLG